MKVHTTRVKASVLGGYVLLASIERNVVAVQLDGDTDRFKQRLLERFDKADLKRASPTTSDAARVLKLYLEGGPDPRFPILLPETGFRVRVWKHLQTIPRGRVRTYGSVARGVRSPAAARAVGQACGANPLPLVVPCHRVVAAGGKLGGFTGPMDAKRRLLAMEGVEFSE